MTAVVIAKPAERGRAPACRIASWLCHCRTADLRQNASMDSLRSQDSLAMTAVVIAKPRNG